MAPMGTIAQNAKELGQPTMVPTMATMRTTNAAALELDSKWTPSRHLHTLRKS